MSQKSKSTYSIYDAADAIELVIGFGLSSDEVGLYLGCSSRAVDFWVRNYYTSTLNDKKRFEKITKKSKV
jgi:hypothetical protein